MEKFTRRSFEQRIYSNQDLRCAVIISKEEDIYESGITRKETKEPIDGNNLFEMAIFQEGLRIEKEFIDYKADSIKPLELSESEFVNLTIVFDLESMGLSKEQIQFYSENRRRHEMGDLQLADLPNEIRFTDKIGCDNLVALMLIVKRYCKDFPFLLPFLRDQVLYNKMKKFSKLFLIHFMIEANVPVELVPVNLLYLGRTVKCSVNLQSGQAEELMLKHFEFRAILQNFSDLPFYLKNDFQKREKRKSKFDEVTEGLKSVGEWFTEFYNRAKGGDNPCPIQLNRYPFFFVEAVEEEVDQQLEYENCQEKLKANETGILQFFQTLTMLRNFQFFVENAKSKIQTIRKKEASDDESNPEISEKKSESESTISEGAESEPEKLVCFGDLQELLTVFVFNQNKFHFDNLVLLFYCRVFEAETLKKINSKLRSIKLYKLEFDDHPHETLICFWMILLEAEKMQKEEKLTEKSSSGKCRKFEKKLEIVRLQQKILKRILKKFSAKFQELSHLHVDIYHYHYQLLFDDDADEHAKIKALKNILMQVRFKETLMVIFIYCKRTKRKRIFEQSLCEVFKNPTFDFVYQNPKTKSDTPKKEERICPRVVMLLPVLYPLRSFWEMKAILRIRRLPLFEDFLEFSLDETRHKDDLKVFAGYARPFMSTDSDAGFDPKREMMTRPILSRIDHISESRRLIRRYRNDKIPNVFVMCNSPIKIESLNYQIYEAFLIKIMESLQDLVCRILEDPKFKKTTRDLLRWREPRPEQWQMTLFKWYIAKVKSEITTLKEAERKRRLRKLMRLSIGCCDFGRFGFRDVDFGSMLENFNQVFDCISQDEFTLEKFLMELETATSVMEAIRSGQETFERSQSELKAYFRSWFSGQGIEQHKRIASKIKKKLLIKIISKDNLEKLFEDDTEKLKRICDNFFNKEKIQKGLSQFGQDLGLRVLSILDQVLWEKTADVKNDLENTLHLNEEFSQLVKELYLQFSELFLGVVGKEGL